MENPHETVAHYVQNIENIKKLDATGLLCPLPVLKARKRLHDMQPREYLYMLADDPGAPKDLADLCKLKGHIIKVQEFLQDKGWSFIIMRSDD